MREQNIGETMIVKKYVTAPPNFKVQIISRINTLKKNSLIRLNEVFFLSPDTVIHRYINWIIVLNVTVGETMITQSNDLSKTDIGQRCRVILVQQIQNWKINTMTM